MIKHKGKYVFFLISHINTKICIGGKIKTISNCSDIEHFDKIFDKMVNKYIEPICTLLEIYKSNGE